MLAHFVFLAVTLALLFRGYQTVRSGALERAIVSTTAATIYLFAMWVPGLLQATGHLPSKLTRTGVLGATTPTELEILASVWVLEVLVIFAAEQLAIRLAPQDLGRRSELGYSRLHWLAYACIAVGLITGLNSQQQLDDRGASGQGVTIFLTSLLVTGIVILAYYWPPHIVHRSVVIVGTLYITTWYVRSPLVAIALAALVGAIHRGHLQRWRSILAIAGLSVLLVFTASAMSSIRGQLILGNQVSSVEQFSSVATNPLISPYLNGVDTLDGYRFSARVAPHVDPEPADMLMVIGTFIPRDLWPKKPTELPVRLSHDYLDYDSSGQFLSAIGYLRLVTGGYWSGLLGLAFLAAIAARAALTVRGSIWVVVIAVMLFRFLLGGSAFDIAYGIRLGVPIAGVVVARAVARNLKGGPRVRGTVRRPRATDQATEVSSTMSPDTSPRVTQYGTEPHAGVPRRALHQQPRRLC